MVCILAKGPVAAKAPAYHDQPPQRLLLNLPDATVPGWHKGLLIRRKINKPEDFTFYLTLALAATTLAELVREAGLRWTVENCFEMAKGEVGLDQDEVRSWTGWHRHITLAMLAHADLAMLRHAATEGNPRPGAAVSAALRLDLLPHTVPELRRLL